MGNKQGIFQRLNNISPECQRELETQLSEVEKTYLEYLSETNLKNNVGYQGRFAKQKLYEFGNKPSKYLAWLVNKKSDTQCISAIKDADSKRKTDAENINKVFYNNIIVSYIKVNNPCLVRASMSFS